jgi:hypothetical protein
MPRPDPLSVRPLPPIDELRGWLAAATGPRVAIHVPIQRSIPEARQNALLLEQAARDAEQRLLALGAAAEFARERAAALTRVDLDLARLSPATRTVALLADAGALHAVGLHTDAPYGVAVGGSTFALRPLLGALRCHTRYHVLAVSVNRVAHFEGDVDGLEEVPLPGVPTSLPDALGQEITGKELRVRGTGRGGAAPVYYSHGSARDEKKVDLVRFHEVLGRALGAALGSSTLPIVLAATEEHQSGLRAEARLPSLVEEALAGNFDHATAAELAARSAPLVEAWLARRFERAAGAWERARNRGKAADLLDDVGAAAIAGRVQRLWVDAGRGLPGRLDPATGRVVAGTGDDDALDALCEAVLVRGGEVVPVDADQLPSPTGAAAELR